MMGLVVMSFVSPSPADEQTGDVARWDFDVYLNDKKVGKHLIPAYRYEHSAAERWSDNCLVEFDARTNANGKRIEVSGEHTGEAFRVESGDRPVELPECVMTFAYWNPEFLLQPRLLNPQTGEYVDVQVEELGNEILEIRGQSVTATRFKLTAYEVDLTLWYSTDDQWLALESIAKGGHVIRYELS
jgi:hypothetical protein